MPRLSPPPSPSSARIRQAIPRWQELTVELQTNLLAHLTRLLQQHLVQAAPGGTEVADDNL
jgi:hypothetical protein